MLPASEPVNPLETVRFEGHGCAAPGHPVMYCTNGSGGVRLMQRPTLAMGVCAALLLGAFAWSGFLPVQAGESAARRSSMRLAQPTAAKVALRVRVVDGFGHPVTAALVDGHACDAVGDANTEVPADPVVDLEVSAPGFHSQFLRTYPVGGEPVVAVLEPVAPWDAVANSLPAVGAAKGEGFVVGPDRRPVEGVHVVVAETGVRTRTDAAGRYELPLSDGPNTFVAQFEGPAGAAFAARSEPVVAGPKGGRRPLSELVLAPASTLRGVVRDDSGTPQRDCFVRIEGGGYRRMLQSGEGGAFAVAGLFPGDYRVEALPHAGSPGGIANVRLEGAAVDCEVRLLRAVPRRVRVVDRGGAPMSTAVIATALHGVRRECERTNADGVVELHFAGSGVDYEVRIAADHRVARVVARNDDEGELVVAAD